LIHDAGDSASASESFKEANVKIVVLGGSGLVGVKLVRKLRRLGHEVVAASRRTGVDAVTGRGLAEALAGAQVVVDVMSPLSSADGSALAFFQEASQNVLSAEAAAGVQHHVALSVVGTDRLLQSNYFRAKTTQEHLIRESGTPFSIIRATQYFEFLSAIAATSSDGHTVRLPPTLIQPISADNIASLVARFAIRQPLDATVEVAGPEVLSLGEAIRRWLVAVGDSRSVLTTAQATYFGTQLDDWSLLPGHGACIGTTHFSSWLETLNRPQPMVGRLVEQVV
jgi:uncharacterized protein YbjT (DUF2867 family)